MKKIVALVLALVLCLAAAASMADGIAKENIKLGVVLLHDEHSTYDLNFMNGAEEAIAALGLNADQLVFAKVKAESPECAEAAEDLIDDGCNMIFFDSYGHQFYTDDIVKKYPNVQFFHATGDLAHTKDKEFPNLQNAFASIYDGRYLAGIAAGMKLNEIKAAGKLKGDVPMIGYVGAYTYAEVISGYTSFYLGAKSVCPDVIMKVQFTGEWYDQQLEKDAAEALIAMGADLISQHADSMGAPTACEDAGIPDVSYNISTEKDCPNTFLVYSRINWAPYFQYIIEKVIAGEDIPTDWVGTIATDSVVVTGLNEKVAAEGTQAAIDAAQAEIVAGTLHVFDVTKDNYITVNGEKVTTHTFEADTEYAKESIADGYFHESEEGFRSAPYFDLKIDGIELLNEKF